VDLCKVALQKAQRDIIEAKARVAAQVAWIAELNRLRHDTAEAVATLNVLTDRLLRCYEDLAQQQAQDAHAARLDSHRGQNEAENAA
jgi:hypothetical protein